MNDKRATGPRRESLERRPRVRAIRARSCSTSAPGCSGGAAKGLPHPEFLEYFISHGALIAALLYATLVFGFRPVYASVWRAWLTCLLYAGCLLPINWLLDTNFMYLRQKPAEPTLLDVMGPWPWYLLTGAGVALAAFFIWYLPFAVAARYSASSRSRMRTSP